MKVTLLAYTPTPEKIVAAAAKLCYSDSSAETIMDGLDDEKTESFVKMLSNIGHESPVEHASFTFGIEGVSRTLLAQITRHRIASFSVQSQRYVRQENFQYITPPAIAQDSHATDIYKKSMQQSVDAYNELADILKEKYIEQFQGSGMSERQIASKAEKKAIEDARFVLPNACETKMLVTMNVRSLRHFFALRCCNRAQWEIKAVADEMLRQCLAVSPALFSNCGPSCVTEGKCPEGKMTCGKFSEVQKYYRELGKC